MEPTMRTREQLVQLRIIHVVIMIATAFYCYQFSNWSDALWIPISVLAIIGPFSPGLAIHKAKQRVIGTIAGLLLSVIVWLLLQYFPNLLPIVAIVLIYGVAFCVLQDYTYFILLVSIMLCVNFDFMNLFFSNEIVFLLNRSMCVLTGVAIFLVYEYYVFRHSYSNAVSLVNCEHLDSIIANSWSKFHALASDKNQLSISEMDNCLNPLVVELDKLSELKESCQYSYSNQEQTLALIVDYEEKLKTIYYWMMSQGYNAAYVKPVLVPEHSYEELDAGGSQPIIESESND